MNRFLIAALPFALFAGAFTASAETDNTSIQGPGCYTGTGCANAGFTQDTNGTTELDLTANIRFISAVTPVGSVYTVPVGSVKPGLALWDYGFSILTQVNGSNVSNGPTLSDYTYLLTVADTTPGDTASFSIDPLSIGDNDGFGTTGKTKASVDQSTEWGAQNFENPGFPDVGFGNAFNPNAPDTYTVTLQEFKNGVQDNSDSITINAQAPEPGTFALAGLVLVGLGLARRKSGKA